MPGLHGITLIEMPRLEKARHAGHNVNPVYGFHAADEISPAADCLAFDAGDKHRGWRGGGLLAGGGGFFLAAGQKRQGQGQNHR